MKTSEHLSVGSLYSRNELRDQFDITDATINTGIFQPQGHDSVWLFVTEEKTADRTQYKDRLVGDDLYFEGQLRGRTDPLIRDHMERGVELLLFHRQKKDEHPNYAFRFEGVFRYLSEKGSEPTKFHLRRVSSGTTTELSVIESVNEIKQNVRRFHRDLSGNAARAKSLAVQTTYWVYDSDTDQFGPAKFIGFQRMNFARYNDAVEGPTTGARFDGGVTRQAIERVAGPFTESRELSDQLSLWITNIFGQEAVAGVDEQKWRFIDLASKRRYWTFVCNPDKYDGLGAMSKLNVLCWTLDRGDPQPDDRVAIWQAKGTSGRRGVIALGEVIAPPAMIEETPTEREFWLDDAPRGPQNRSRFRVIKTPNLPLWEDDHPNLLPHLAAARAKGGTVFSLQPEQWNALLALATDEEKIVLPSRKVRATSQGYGLNAIERKAVERHAQSMAEDHFLKLKYEVTDVSLTQPYDLHCTRGAQELHVEVKGTTGEGETVFLTRNEVQHARENAGQVALYVVSRIVLDRSGETPIASGGEVAIFHPWEIDQGTLAPLQFEYGLPPAEDSA